MQGPSDNNQFSLSYELLYVLQWITDNEYDILKKIIHRALSEGGVNKMNKAVQHNADDLSAQAHQTIIDFFALLEAALINVIHEDNVKYSTQRTILPALNQLDIDPNDDDTVAASAAQVTTAHKKNPGLDAQELLFKALLKRWKPDKKLLNN